MMTAAEDDDFADAKLLLEHYELFLRTQIRILTRYLRCVQLCRGDASISFADIQQLQTAMLRELAQAAHRFGSPGCTVTDTTNWDSIDT